MRRAHLAGYDRVGEARIAGGRRSEIATHFIPPGVPGFEGAGGRRGPGFDFVSDLDGSRARAARYLRRAGFPGGRHTGRAPIVLGAPDDPAVRDQVRFQRRQFERLGFRVPLRVMAPQRLLEACQTANARIRVCPFGWYRDFPDAQSVLDALFNGRSIQPQGNTNVPQPNVPAINAAMEAAKALSDPAERARAWARIDRRIVAEAPAVPQVWPRSVNLR